MSAAKPREVLVVRIAPDGLAYLRDWAKTTDTTVSAIVRDAVSQAITRREATTP